MGKSEKKSKKHRKEKDKSKKNRSKNSDLIPLLSKGILIFPNLIDELPLLCHSFNEGDTVNLDKISNVEYRDYLKEIFKHLPVELSQHGGLALRKDVKSLNNFLLSILINDGAIIQPNNLSEMQSLAFDAAKVIIDILKFSKELQSEVVGLLEALLDDTIINLQSIENIDVQELIEKLFKKLRLSYNEDVGVSGSDDESIEPGYFIPNNDERNGHIIRDAIQLILQSMDHESSSCRRYDDERDLGDMALTSTCLFGKTVYTLSWCPMVSEYSFYFL